MRLWRLVRGEFFSFFSFFLLVIREVSTCVGDLGFLAFFESCSDDVADVTFFSGEGQVLCGFGRVFGQRGRGALKRTYH